MSGTGSGRKIYISDAFVPDADLDLAGFEALTYIQIGRVGTFADIPMSTNFPTFSELLRDIADKQKGVTTPGDTSCEVRPVATDLGQIQLAAAALTRKSWAFKIEDDDAPSVSSTNSIMYVRSVIGAATEGLGGSDDFRTESYPIGVQPLPVKKAPTGLSAPANTILPAIAGIAQVGNTLYASTGTWTGFPAFTYQWQADDAGNGTFADISGATGASYAPVVGNVGDALRVKVTGTNADSAVAAYSAPTQVLLAAA